MMSDEENVEVVPLNTKLSSSSSQFSPPRNGNWAIAWISITLGGIVMLLGSMVVCYLWSCARLSCNNASAVAKKV
jgi:hypothetical protein